VAELESQLPWRDMYRLERQAAVKEELARLWLLEGGALA
jgi:hypothetical protein